MPERTQPSAASPIPAGADRPGLVGARVKRREDPRFITGQGRYVSDLRLPGMVEATFIRSPLAHAEIRSIDSTLAAGSDGVHAILTGEQIAETARPMRGDVEFDGWQTSPFPAVACGRVRFVGEAVAMVIADDRYLAEDAAELVDVDYEPLPVLASTEAALAPDAAPMHEGWTDNCFLRRSMRFGDPDKAFGEADGVLELETFTGRSSGIPLEGRACLAEFDRGRQTLTLWTSTQIPHLIRTGLADHLDLPEHNVRVISPDVGGGFGIKTQLYGEELAVSVAAMTLGRPVRWIEDRQEHMLATMHARQHHHQLQVAYTNDGIVTGLRATVTIDCGAYSPWPWTASGEAGMATRIMTGQYKIENYEYTGLSVATNKCFIGSYRGVARPSVNMTIERVMDEVGHAVGIDPLEIRRRNYVQPDEFPYQSATGMLLDSGSFVESLEKVLQDSGYAELRERQAAARAEGRYLGIGFASYTEQTAHGSREWAKRGTVVVPGFDSALVRLDPGGTVSVYVSTHSHGQGHETTIGQVVAAEFGLPLERIRVQFGDTASAPYGHGTFASRSAVMGGGAALQSSQIVIRRLKELAAHLLEANPDDLELRDGRVVTVDSDEGYTIAELARIAYHKPHLMPDGAQSVLEASTSYDASPGSGTYANAAHLALVEVDPELGSVKVLGYWVTEDCGTMINPMIVDGQVHGGVAQGLGGALMEEFVYNEDGQLLTTTLKDYRLIGSTDVPSIKVTHLATPSPTTLLGTKGMGEGGAISPGPAVASAVADALSPIGHVFVNELPLTPERVRRFVAIARADGAARSGGRA